MIRVENIHKSYSSIEVLKGLTMSIEDEEIISIVGASGAGKSTLLHIIGTIDNADSGKIIYDDCDISQLKSDELADFRNKNIGFVFQYHHLLAEFNVLENICIPAWINRQDRQAIEKRALELIRLLNLEHRIYNKANHLSGGEQQRVAVARALINSPKVILADEPSGNLDMKNKQELHQLFFRLRKELGQTFVIVTHDMDLAEMSDRKIQIQDGLIL